MTGKADAVLTAKIAHRFLKEPQSDLNSYSGLSVAAAVCLSKHKGELTLDGLSSLSDAVAESLGHHEGSLSLGGLTGLSNAAAASLSKHKGDLTLDCVTSFSIRDRRAFGGCRS